MHGLRDPALGRTAHLFQRQIAKGYEARAIVVGEQIFAARIDGASQAARTDWRSDYDSLSYTPVTLPAELRTKLIRLHRRLGLEYGAVDLICDLEEQWVFLETNQGGEFGWLADEAGLPVPQALADLLEGR